MPADYAMVPPFPRGGWNANQPPFPEIAPTTQLTTLPSGLRVVSCVEIKIYGAFLLNHRVVLHAIDATPARWRGAPDSLVDVHTGH